MYFKLLLQLNFENAIYLRNFQFILQVSKEFECNFIKSSFEKLEINLFIIVVSLFCDFYI